MSRSFPEADAARVIVERLRAKLLSVATRVGATLDEESAELMSDPVLVFTLSSDVPGTATIEVIPVGAWSIHLRVGEAGHIEVFASFRAPEAGVADAVAIVEAIVEGRLKERVWRRWGNGSVVGSALRIRIEPHSRWSIIGQVGAVAPLIGRLFYRTVVVRYAPFAGHSERQHDGAVTGG